MEYKFRGKRKDNGEWVYGSLVTDTPGTRYSIIDYANSDTETYSWHDVIPETVGMWTGIIRNKIEVYEGDVVNDSVRNYLIVWDVREAKFILQFIYDEPVEGICQTSKAMPIDGFMLIVIGNKIDHPNLLIPAQRRAY